MRVGAHYTGYGGEFALFSASATPSLMSSMITFQPSGQNPILVVSSHQTGLILTNHHRITQIGQEPTNDCAVSSMIVFDSRKSTIMQLIYLAVYKTTVK